MAIRFMFDSASIPEPFPANPSIVAGYVDGAYRTFADEVTRFPNAVHIPIAVFAHTNDGIILDCEPGDATPAQCPGWLKMRHAAGVVRPGIYCSLTDADAVKAACSAAGLVLNRDWFLGVADYNRNLTPTGAGEVFKQYTDVGPNGENYDTSAVYDDAFPYLAGDADMNPDQVNYVLTALGQCVQMLTNVQAAAGRDVDIKAELDAVKAEVDQLKAGGGQVDVKAVASAVADELERRLAS